MKLSLPKIPEIPVPSFSSLSSVVTGSVVGVDIGTSSVKVVQLRREHGTVILDSYGQIQLDAYRDATESEAGAVAPQQVANALLDLMHEVEITAQTGGVAIASSAALVSVVHTPTRDGEQLDAHMQTEAQKYIPVPVHEVFVEWSIIPDTTRENIFDKKNESSNVTAATQKVLLTAVNKEKVAIYKRILDLAGIASQFHEIETFSGARAVGALGAEAVLLADLGATSTKLSVVESGVIHSTHVAQMGGRDLTQATATSMNIAKDKAEVEKKEHGLTPALTEALAPLVGEVERVIANYREAEKKPISKIVLFGGGACLKGVETAFARLALPVEVARPFKNTKGPMVLEARLHDDGPIFANAIGLALRALG